MFVLNEEEKIRVYLDIVDDADWSLLCRSCWQSSRIFCMVPNSSPLTSIIMLY